MYGPSMCNSHIPIQPSLLNTNFLSTGAWEIYIGGKGKNGWGYRKHAQPVCTHPYPQGWRRGHHPLPNMARSTSLPSSGLEDPVNARSVQICECHFIHGQQSSHAAQEGKSGGGVFEIPPYPQRHLPVRILDMGLCTSFLLPPRSQQAACTCVA